MSPEFQGPLGPRGGGRHGDHPGEGVRSRPPGNERASYHARFDEEEVEDIPRPAPPGFADRPGGGRIGDVGPDGQAVAGDGAPDDEEFHRMWLEATPDSIGPAVMHVRHLLDDVRTDGERELLEYWHRVLVQLEHWLRDR